MELVPQLQKKKGGVFYPHWIMILKRNLMSLLKYP